MVYQYHTASAWYSNNLWCIAQTIDRHQTVAASALRGKVQGGGDFRQQSERGKDGKKGWQGKVREQDWSNRRPLILPYPFSRVLMLVQLGVKPCPLPHIFLYITITVNVHVLWDKFINYWTTVNYTIIFPADSPWINIREKSNWLSLSLCLWLTLWYWFADFFSDWDFSQIFSIFH